MIKKTFFILSWFFLGSLCVASDLDYNEQFKHIQSNHSFSGGKIFIQSGMKAEYIESKDYRKPNFITITIQGKKNTIKLPSSKESLDCMKKNQLDNQGNKISEIDLIGICFYRFGGFREFSPSGYYLSYTELGWESTRDILLDTRTGKTIIATDLNEFIGWTKDNKQFVYGGSSGMGSNRGLYISIKGQFPKVKQILNEDIQGGYIDEKNIYVKTYEFLEGKNSSLEYYKVIDIKTLKVIYTKKID